MIDQGTVGRFEQVLNALYLEKLGYGQHATALTANTIGEFLERVEQG